jgi:hypothetical protein
MVAGKVLCPSASHLRMRGAPPEGTRATAVFPPARHVKWQMGAVGVIEPRSIGFGLCALDSLRLGSSEQEDL